jgi:hypothetical protein
MDRRRGGARRRAPLALALLAAACGAGAGDATVDEPAADEPAGGQPSGEEVVARGGLGRPGPGDAGNHLPLAPGDRWVFATGSASRFSPVPPPSVSVVTVEGSREIAGVQATIVRAQDAWGAVEVPRVPDANGVASFGPSGSWIASRPELLPYWELQFPLEPGRRFVQLDREGLPLGEDRNGDGQEDVLAVYSTVTVAGIEAVTVPVGTFADCVRVETRRTDTVTSSGDPMPRRTTTFETTWLAPGVGWVKRVRGVSVEFGSTSSSVEELLAYSVGGRSAQVALRASPAAVALAVGAAPVRIDALATTAAGADLPVVATWTSSDPAVARVAFPGPRSASATVTAVAPGAATITAAVDGVASAVARVEVVDGSPAP